MNVYGFLALSSAVSGERLTSGNVMIYMEPKMITNDFNLFWPLQTANLRRFSRKDIIRKAATKQQLTYIVVLKYSYYTSVQMLLLDNNNACL